MPEPLRKLCLLCETDLEPLRLGEGEETTVYNCPNEDCEHYGVLTLGYNETGAEEDSEDEED